MRFAIISVLFFSLSLLAEDAPAPVQTPPQPAVQQPPQVAPQRPTLSPQQAVPPNAMQRPGAMRPGMPPMFGGSSHGEEWNLAMDKLNSLPGPGDIQNGRLSTTIADVFGLQADQKASLTALGKEYEKTILEKEAKWEAEEKASRDEYEAKAIALLPANKQEAAKKLLDYSHANWISRMQQQLTANKARMQAQEEIRKLPQDQQQTHLQASSKAFFEKQQAQADETMKAMKALLEPEDAAKLEAANPPSMGMPGQGHPGMRPMPPAKQPAPAAPAAPVAVPQPPAAPATAQPVIVPPPAKAPEGQPAEDKK